MVNIMDRFEKDVDGHIYTFCVGSLTRKMIEATTKFGVIKLKYALKERGYDPDNIIVVYGPGSGITNTPRERRAGFEDGARLLTKDVIVPYIKPACGYYVGKVPYEKMSKKEIDEIEKTYEKIKSSFQVDGYEVSAWTDKLNPNSNHFLELWRLSNFSDNHLEEGLYLGIHTEFDHNHEMWKEAKEELAEKVRTPLGEIEIIEGNDKDRFLREMEKIEELSKKKRRVLASLLVEDIEEVFNENHKKYFRNGNWYGSDASNYFSVDSKGRPQYVPICFDEEEPVYLVKGKRNVNRNIWPEDYKKRVYEKGFDRLIEQINILPHGGGETKDDYLFDNLRIDLSSQEIILEGNGEIKRIKDPSKELGRRFRKPEEVIPQIETFGLGKIVGKFDHVYTFTKKLY